MQESLRAAYVFLLEAYGQIHGSSLLRFQEGESLNPNFPTWTWYKKDMETRLESEDSDVGVALLLDPEVALCYYIIPFNVATEPQEHLSNALSLASDLEPSWDVSREDSDPRGAWQVALHWLVEDVDYSTWEASIISLRHETAHFDDIAIDVTVGSKGDWKNRIEERGFPRLLLRMRELLAKESEDEISNWASADEDVLRAISEMMKGVENSQFVALANEVSKFAQSATLKTGGSTVEWQGGELRSLDTLEIANFRNIADLRVQFRSPGQLIGSTVITGPNGSGKSNIVEAISFALCGMSERFREFLEDSNITSTSKSADYRANYLTPLTGTGEPRILVNGTKAPIDLEIEKGEARQVLQEISGTIISQNRASRLVHTSASDLGAEVAASYSRIADQVLDFIEDRYREVRSTQERVFEQWGLSLRVQKLETARQQITERILSEVYAPSPHLGEWLKTVVSEGLPSIPNAADLKTSWEEVDALIQDAAKRAKSGELATLRGSIRELHTKALELAEETADVLGKLRERTERWPSNVIQMIREWAEWRKTTNAAWDSEGAGGKTSKDELATLKEKSDEAECRKSQLQARLTHLQTAKRLLSDPWIRVFGEHCPTCNSDMSTRGGIRKTLEDVFAETKDASKVLEEAHAKLLEQISEKAAPVRPGSPLSSLEMEHLGRSLGWVVPEGAILWAALSNPEQAVRIVSLAQLALSGRSIPFPGILETPMAMEESLERISKAMKQVEDASSMPEHWREIRSRLTSDLTGIVERKLPKTLQALWLELAENMTPDGWQLPGRIRIDVQSRRREPFARITVTSESRTSLAAYILNHAECHTLGLAWFILRYITYGRFRYSCLVLDDPRQDMDQPAFRSLSRFLKSLVRIHSVHELPLVVVVLMHHEASAIQISKDLQAVLHVLDWSRRDLHQPKSMRLRGDNFRPLKPSVVLQRN